MWTMPPGVSRSSGVIAASWWNRLPHSTQAARWPRRIAGMPPVTWPLALTFARLALGPALLLFAWTHPESGPWLAAAVVFGFLTDLFDGILARKLNVASPRIRRLDSQTDLVFWLCVVGCVFVVRYDIAIANAGCILGILVLEAAIYGISFAKFGR